MGPIPTISASNAKYCDFSSSVNSATMLTILVGRVDLLLRFLERLRRVVVDAFGWCLLLMLFVFDCFFAGLAHELVVDSSEEGAVEAVDVEASSSLLTDCLFCSFLVGRRLRRVFFVEALVGVTMAALLGDLFSD